MIHHNAKRFRLFDLTDEIRDEMTGDGLDPISIDDAVAIAIDVDTALVRAGFDTSNSTLFC